MDNSTLKEGFLGQRMVVLPHGVKKLLRTNPITKSFYITDMGYYPKAGHHFRIRKKGAGEYIFIYCTEGEGWLKMRGKETRVLPNHFFIIPKNTAHNYGAIDDNPWSIYWMHFDGLVAQNLFERYYSISQLTHTTPFDNTRIKLFNQIFEILKINYTESQMEYANILGLNFLSSFVFSNSNGLPSNNDHDNLVDSIITYLNQNLDKSLNSKDIAKTFNYSPSYIFTLFKKRTGYSLIHFFNLKKIQKACEYINYTELSIKEVSFKLGFQDPLYFSRIFKKYMGVSPKAYRQEITT